MVFGSLFLDAVGWRKLRRAAPASPACVPRAPHRAPADLPAGVAAVEAELRDVLDALHAAAAERSVALRIACAPDLLAVVDPAALRACLRALLTEAIERAVGSVLATAERRQGAIEITLIDDGGWSPPGRPTCRGLPPGIESAIQHRADIGTTVVLRMPCLAAGESSADDRNNARP